MDSFRTLFTTTLIMTILCGLSSALTTDELGNFTQVTDSTWTFTDTDYVPSFKITDVTWGKASNSFHLFESNGIPDYSGVDGYVTWYNNGGNNKDIAEQTYTKCIPESPTALDTPYTFLGTVGFMVNGAPLWTYYTSSGNDAVADETFDTVGGHPSPGERYHFHGWNDFTELEAFITDFKTTSCPAPIVGVALDGYPIYGAQNCSCSTGDDCYEGDFTSADLDECHGREIDGSQAGDSDKGDYEYRLTADAPYHISCLHGEQWNKPCYSTKRDMEITEKEKELRTRNKLRGLLKAILNKE